MKLEKSDIKDEYSEIIGVSYYKCFYDERFIGELYLRGSFTSDEFNIMYLKVNEKGKGWGSLICDYLKSFEKPIKGLSYVESREFWERQGAVFLDNDNFIIYN